jgi:serine/threonine protein kinase
VIRFVESFMSDRTLFIAMEYCNGGDLDIYLKKKKRLTEE